MNASECNQIGNYLFFQQTKTQHQQQQQQQRSIQNEVKIASVECSKYDLVENIKHAVAWNSIRGKSISFFFVLLRAKYLCQHWTTRSDPVSNVQCI